MGWNWEETPRRIVDMAMYRAAFILFALVATASAGESRIDTALLASAQKAVPGEIATNQLVRALESGLWNSNRTAVAVSITQPKASVIEQPGPRAVWKHAWRGAEFGSC